MSALGKEGDASSITAKEITELFNLIYKSAIVM